MNLARKIILPVIAIAAVLAGTPVALATTSPGTAPAAAAPATAHLTGAHLTAAYSPDVPALRWFYWSTYPTLKACNSEGQHLFLIFSIENWKCTAASAGEYIDYELFVILGHGPGA